MNEMKCGHCSMTFSEESALFRCQNRRCPGQQVDLTYAQWHSGSPSMMGRVFLTKKTAIERLFGIEPSKAVCSECHEASSSKVCPVCHHQLNIRQDHDEDGCIVVLGSSGSGRSAFVGTLIDRLTDTDRYAKLRIEFPSDDARFQLQNARDAFGAAQRTVKSENRTPYPSPFEFYVDTSGKKLTSVIVFHGPDDIQHTLSDDGLSTKVESAISQALGLVLLIDTTGLQHVHNKLPELRRQESNIASSQLHSSDLQVKRLLEFVNPGGKVSLPTAIILTKIDAAFPLLASNSLLLQPIAFGESTSNYIADPAGIDARSDEVAKYLEIWGPSLYGLIADKFETSKYFAVCCYEDDRPFLSRFRDTHSIRVEEPLFWLLANLGQLKLSTW